MSDRPITRRDIEDNIGCILNINPDMYIDIWKDSGDQVYYTSKDNLHGRWCSIDKLVEFINTTFGGICV